MFAVQVVGVLEVGQGTGIVFEVEAQAGDFKGQILFFTDREVALPDLVDRSNDDRLFLWSKGGGQILQPRQVAGKLVTIVVAQAQVGEDIGEGELVEGLLDVFGDAEEVVGAEGLDMTVVGPLSVAVTAGVVTQKQSNHIKTLGFSAGDEGDATLLFTEGFEQGVVDAEGEAAVMDNGFGRSVALKFAEIGAAFVGGEEQQSLLGEGLQTLEAEQSSGGDEQVGVGEGVLVVAEQGLNGGRLIAEVGGLVVVVEIEMVEELGGAEGLGIAIAGQRNQAVVDLLVVDVVEILGDAVIEVVGDRHQGLLESVWSNGFATMVQGELIGVVDVKQGGVEDALLEEGLEAGVVVPVVEVGWGEVGEDVAKGGEGELEVLAEVGEVGEEVEGKATGTGS